MVTLEEENFKGLLSGWGLGLAARPCDTCRVTAALLYCRVDAAFLCGACDTKIHRHVAARHERVWMCEVCEQAPAAVTCKADAAALCTACDRDIHSANPLARRHERVPVIPFLDSVSDAAVRSSAAVPANLLVPDVVVPMEDDAEAWLIPNPNFLYNNDSDLLDLLGHHKSGSVQEKKPFTQQQQQHIQPPNVNVNVNVNANSNTSFEFAFTDSVVPTQSSNGNNLRFSNDVNIHHQSSFHNSFDIDFSQPNKHQNIISTTFNNYSSQHSVSSSDIGVVPDGNMSEVSYTFAKSMTNSGDGISSATTGAPAPAMDREARVLRYREKRKNRKFEKTIRYASRKAYAETRPRIKGRFAKRTSDSGSDVSEIDHIFGSRSSAGFAIDHGGYGVVPSF